MEGLRITFSSGPSSVLRRARASERITQVSLRKRLGPQMVFPAPWSEGRDEGFERTFTHSALTRGGGRNAKSKRPQPLEVTT